MNDTFIPNSLDNQIPYQTHLDILRWRALHQSEALAYSFLADGEVEEARFTYAELDQLARRIAAQLQQIGAQGEPVLLLHPPGLEYVAAFFACLYAGAIAVPAYPPSSQRSFQRIEAIIADSQAKVVLTTTRLLAKLHRSSDLATSLQAVHWITTDTIQAGLEDLWQDPKITPDSLAFLQYTSGSTAIPKGVMVSHGNLMHNNQATQASSRCIANSPLINWLPLFHDMGLIANLLLAMYLGIPCILMPPSAFIQKPFRWLQAISKYKAQASGGPNFAYELCVQRISPEQRALLDLSHWKIAFCGAEPIHAQTLANFAETFAECGFRAQAFWPGYGLAESTVFVSGNQGQEHPVILTIQKKAIENNQVLAATEQEEKSSLVGCGHTWAGQRAIIVDPESLTLSTPDSIGEIWLSGPSVAHGYWRRPEETKETFQAFLKDSGEGPFLRTGDLGFLRDDQLFITGRSKDLIIIHGRNLYPQDLERTAALSHPSLRPAGVAAFSVPLANEERVVIVQEIERHHSQWDIQEIFAAIRQAISAEHEVALHAIVLIKAASLPKTSSGKVQRHACKQGFLTHELDVVAQWIEPAQDKKPTQADSVREAPLKVASSQQHTSQAIISWLTTTLSEHLSISPQKIDIREPLAHYGLDSLTSVRIIGDLEQWLGYSLSPTLAYEYPSIEALARHLAQISSVSTNEHIPDSSRLTTNEPIAIIGMSCRFPGAPDPDAFWQLLRGGGDAIGAIPADRWDIQRFYDPDPGASGKMYTQSGGFLPDISMFDANFFGISPREAVRIDPQQRLLLEVAWEALENAGQAVDALAGSQTGVFIGMLQTSEYSQLQMRANHTEALDDPYFGIGSSPSMAAGRLSYLFDFQGPTMTIDTACSSSLVATHLACQSLRNGESRMALVGGVNTLLLPESMVNACKMRMLASDGHCKTFDAAADGYAMAEGCGVVVLKRLSDALAGHDNIRAVIRGSAINQDGRSNGITAPNKLAQKSVIRQALHNAGIEPHHVSYVETHGSGTALGDSIEAEALADTLSAGRSAEQRLFIGSVKTNIGHLLGAAGIAGLLKTVLALQHKEIPPHLHVNTLTPYVSWKDTPLTIPTEPTPWSNSSGRRIAGVSSFGWSGTNVHLIVEEANTTALPSQDRPYHLITLSARTASALEAVSRRFTAYLNDHPQTNFADIVYTSQVGRTAFDHRRMLVCRNREDALAALEAQDTQRILTHLRPAHQRPVVFLFPGIGEQYPGMARELYQQEVAFRQIVDTCCSYLQQHHGLDLRPALQLDRPIESDAPSNHTSRLDLRSLLARRTSAPSTHNPLVETLLAQPAVFVIEYALARLLQSWGIRPHALLGYSLGEYVAACVAGVLSLEDSLNLVLQRASLIDTLPTGAMLAVMLSAEQIKAYLTEELSLAAINGPQTCVLAGTPEAILRLEKHLHHDEIVFRRVETTHPFHSHLLEPVREPLLQLLATMPLQPPQIPYISNVTGTWITAQEATDPTYWGRHLCQTVRWSQGVETLLQGGEQILLEVGPGQSLGSFVRQHPHCTREQMGWMLPTLPAAQEKLSSYQMLLTTMGKVWLAGGSVDWQGMATGQQRKRVILPTYPFEQQRYWVETDATSNGHLAQQEQALMGEKLDSTRWFFVPSWKQSDAQIQSGKQDFTQRKQQWLVFADEHGLGHALLAHLQELEQDVIVITAGQALQQLHEKAYTLNPHNPDDYNQLFKQLYLTHSIPQHIVHLWSLTTGDNVVEHFENLDEALYHNFYSLLFLAQASGKLPYTPAIQLFVLSNNAYDVIGGEIQYPEKAMSLGLCKVLAKEYPNISYRCIDIHFPTSHAKQQENIVKQLMREFQSVSTDELVAYRGSHRWTQIFEPTHLSNEGDKKTLLLRDKGVYLITGGLGGLGSAVAEYLARIFHARLILVGRSPFPTRELWIEWLEHHPAEDPISIKIRNLLQMEEYGAEILLAQADITNPEQVQQVIAQAHKQFGKISGVFHAAGVPGQGLLQAKTPDMIQRVFAPKIDGTLVLHRLLQDEQLDFMLLYSSSVAITGGLGEGDYAAANAFLDAFAQYAQYAQYNTTHQGQLTLSVNWGPWCWDAWQEAAFATAPDVYAKMRHIREHNGITFQEGEQVIRQILAQTLPQILVLPQGLQATIQQAQALSSSSFVEALNATETSAHTLYPRPHLRTPYVAPSNEAEQHITLVWQKYLGIEQIGIHDHFFELGGNSLVGIQIITQLQKELHAQFSIATLFERPTIGALAAILHTDQQAIPDDLQVSSARGKQRKVRVKTIKRSPLTI